MNQVTLSIIQIFISLVFESVILAGVFSFLSNKANEKQEQNLKQELFKVEHQNTFIYQELEKAISQGKTEIISQIKESIKSGNR